MKRVGFILLLGSLAMAARADHITGGEMFYTYNGFSSGLHHYSVTLKLYMRCNSGRQFPDPGIISVFEKESYRRIEDISVFISNRNTIQITTFDPCISNPPTVCYEVAYYHFIVSVPESKTGYLLSSQVNFRIRGMNNVYQDAQTGATYTADIPGSTPAPNAQANNSAYFTGSDLVVVCAGNFFSYSFAAADGDKQNIRYSFCAAYATNGGGPGGNPASDPPYSSVLYGPGYSEHAPLGETVVINSTTGLITGTAPEAGTYVVTVCAEEIKDGKVIAVQRKDIQINVADCNIAAAVLDGEYMLCGDSRSLSITNKATSPLIVSTDWEVFNPVGASIHTSSAFALNYTFPTNGIYSVRLVINKGQLCSDTTFTKVYVFPGLVPDFSAAGICITRPTSFSDRSTLISGSINSWSWEFGDPVFTDTSTVRNPSYAYQSPGTKDVRLIVTTTDGCKDTVRKTVTIVDKPPIALAFRDTLICVNDVLQLFAAGTGNFNWSPSANMINPLSPAPTVSPAQTTTYYVDLETDGCRNRDSLRVRVVDHVTLTVMNDTLICRGDTIQLRSTSDGLRYAWQPASQVLTPGWADPFVVTSNNTSYQVVATIGGCSSSATVAVATVPYPVANAGADTIICHQTTAQLQGSTDGSSFIWSPASTLSNPAVLNPVSYPALPENVYVLSAFDTRGCPKPGRDTVVVKMLPPIIPFAGRDTTVVINQPLQLQASGGEFYQWFPATSLSSSTIPNPVAIFYEPSTGIRYQLKVSNIAGCTDSAFLTIKVFATLPTVFVPTGFTPNNDGKNDILKPVAVGMKHIEHFSVYNRWGQLVFRTSTDGHGWDGRIGGQLQPTNTYVWLVKAVDFTGKAYFQKGMTTLIR
jgi:gliding motility-associated-like protein